MHFRILRRSFSSAISLGLLVCSCSPTGGSSAAGARVVGFAQIGAESTWRSAETTSIREEAETRGWQLKLADAQQDQQKQIQALRSFVAQGVDAILLAPVVSTGWEPVLREVHAAGIPVVLVDRGIEASGENLYATLVASDFVAEGRMAAEWLASESGGNARVVELEGTPGSDPANDRNKGFAEGIAAHPGITVVRSESALFSMAKAKEVMEALIQTLGADGFDAVYAHNDDMALGAIQALESAGKKPGTDVRIVSIDGVRGAFDAMVAGKLDATVECNPLLGPAAFDALERVLAGETLPKWIQVEDRLFTKEQAASVLPERRY